MTITVGLFGPLKEACEQDTLVLTWQSGMTAGEAKTMAMEQLSGRLKQKPSQILVATEHDYLAPEQPLEDGSTIYLLPPFGGG